MTTGVLLFDDVEELDFVGPWEMLTMWQQVAGGPPCVTVSATGAPVRCAKGLSVVPQHSFATCPPLDVLLVPGGQGTRREVGNPELLAFVRQQAARAQAVLSVCTGAFVLHAAGLLSGKRATTHWASLQRLRDLGDVNVVEARWVRDGDTWTAAGVSAGMDMALAFIAATAGEAVAGKVQLAAEYYPDGVRHGGPAAHTLAPRYAHTAGESP
ncbi:thiamine biosynthesis protein ThiJ [Comamonas serinivorans]|uniref:Thiamine biosynthesis protein ThiJ n=1 Tax=Comamonas serinivorans TaxID=1082851 RepID=A0A1Y0ETG7_9BURK|nr:DJ-1/PfpI family protein [Comamonas serinivorans]ARU06967.1 thiamine biosynthesis protein ThiJ [Comamonas serinivorans]